MRKKAILALEVAVFALGVVICLIGAVLMAFGEGLVGENHTGIATVVGIVGIVIIGIIGCSGAIIAGSAIPSAKGVPKKRNDQPEVC